jgi:hypothetical protein
MAAQDRLVAAGRLDVSGGLLAAGQVRTDEKGRVTVEGREVWGRFQLEGGGSVVAGAVSMTVEGQLDAADNGVLFGAFSLVEEVGAERALIWEGHWAGQVVGGAIVGGTMIARGRERFAGRALRLGMTDVGATGGLQFTLRGATRAAVEIGVTGITTSLGGVLSEPQQSRDAQGRLLLRHWRVTGTQLLNVGGVPVRGKEFFDINQNSIQGDDTTGTVYGPYRFTMTSAGEEITIFEGHFAGRELKALGASKLLASGRGPFAGYALDLDMEELPATAVNPAPNVYFVDGFVRRLRSVTVTGVSDSLGEFKFGQVTPGPSGKNRVRDRVVTGSLALRVGEVEVTGRQIFEERGLEDARSLGLVYGTFRLTGKGDATVWQGHFRAASYPLGRVAEMSGLGYGPFAGKRIHLRLTEIAGFEGNADPQIYLLDGEVSELAETGVTGYMANGGLEAAATRERDPLGRLRMRGQVQGDWSFLAGGTVTAGRQVLTLDAVMDDRQTGPVSGALSLNDEQGVGQWEGEWSGRLWEAIPAGTVALRGRGRCAGSEIRLSSWEPPAPLAFNWGPPGSPGGPALSADPDLSVLLLDGQQVSVRPAGGKRKP